MNIEFVESTAKLVDHMGNDLKTVNMARASFKKHKTIFDDTDKRLIKYLATHEHTSPFRHNQLTFHIICPVFIARQWVKHCVGATWSEASRRYLGDDWEFWLPDEWRQDAENVKQGSGDPLAVDLSKQADSIYENHAAESYRAYCQLRTLGVCREQARVVMPLCHMTHVYWTASLQAVAHFCKLRLDSHAQKEIQVLAQQIYDQTFEKFPLSMNALMGITNDQ